MGTQTTQAIAESTQSTQKPLTQSPLERLDNLLRDDMACVNARIIENMQSDVALIPQLAGYLIAAGGKRIRPMLTLASTRLFDCQSGRSSDLAACVEFIHTATLLHDDVVDESDQRRGKDAANLVFGNQATVLVGDYLFSRAFQLMVKDGSLDVLRILSDASAVIAEGEVMQLSTTNNLETTLDDYKHVIKSKTAALFAAACEIGPHIAGVDLNMASSMRDYGMYLGMAFQVVDDVLDYNAEQDKLGKTVGDDFAEGKMTAPVIIALQKCSPEEREFFYRTLGEKKQTEGDLKQAQEVLQRTGALEEGMVLAEEYARQARESLKNIPDNEYKSALVDLAGYVVQRAS